MKYMGSKRRIIKYIKPYFKPFLYLPKYIEPFVGGCNAIAQVDHPNRHGYDIHSELIHMWKALQNGWIPPDHVSEELWEECRCNLPHISTELRAFIGFCCSFGGSYFSGIARNPDRCYATEGKKLIKETLNSIRNVAIEHESYDKVDISNALVYCDPPYQGTSEYTNSFDSNEFFQWCLDHKNTSPILISESTIPKDFRCIWSTTKKSIIRRKDKTPIDELLLVPTGGISDINYPLWFEDEFQECLEPLEEYRL